MVLERFLVMSIVFSILGRWSLGAAADCFGCLVLRELHLGRGTESTETLERGCTQSQSPEAEKSTGKTRNRNPGVLERWKRVYARDPQFSLGFAV